MLLDRSFQNIAACRLKQLSSQVTVLSHDFFVEGKEQVGLCFFTMSLMYSGADLLSTSFIHQRVDL